ncbi:unnamed protein product [Heligmosomoides polygyrus]|uniref:Peroxisomal membrane protein 4 n=1 Tax=Heligmosomoides polygyrus TaxID=6339 RepID=A0A183GAS9_HELPZ|nr:unnamed protein product [Heligmosomoides polygyrus]
MIATVIHLIRHWESLGNEFLKTFKDQHHILSALKGLRNGVVYGARIRAPHALVMVFLFGEGTLAEKLQTILRLTKTHAMNLAKFVFSYKLCQGILQRLEGHRQEWHSFVAAFVMGYFVFGHNNAVNMQINLYLLSRITVGLAKLAVDNEVIPQPNFPVFPLFAAAVWGIVLWLFEHHTNVLQGSLVKSMTYLYKDSNYWTDIRNFLLRNK